ncbi:hypothetical protein D9757_010969 [Collybiopsis confluens]|uniref:Fungal-type protein kinase domain-containing protein n=1 Tax=Collybiopsis confluens TaxID=2823264 RepID=A0A8H5LSD5_9AGAR|nr:hypothetical protein D9757_010969 [Collybiopsis confluens]
METATSKKGIYHQITKLLDRIRMRPKGDANDTEDTTFDNGDGKVFNIQNPFKIPGYLINKVEDLEVLIRAFEFSKGMRWALLLLFVEVKRRAAQVFCRAPSPTKRFSPEPLAAENETAQDSESDPVSLEGAPFSLLGSDGTERYFTIKHLIYKAKCTAGQGSTVFLVDCGGEDDEKWAPKGKQFVVKFSFPSKTHPSEAEFVIRARELASNGQEWALQHLPFIRDCVTIPFGPDAVQRRHSRFSTICKEYHERCTLHITIFEPLCSLDELKTPEEAAQVFYDILQVHCWLYTEAKILHRDLSMGNITFRRVGGKVYGVLNDLDLSSFLPLRDEPSSQWRTGTKPYMAYDLLTKDWREGPLYRHDLESLFYIMLILCCHYDSPDKALPFKDWPYHKWFTSGDATVATDKGVFLVWNQSAFPLQSHFERFRKWLDDIYRCFSVGYMQRQLRRRGDPLKDAEQQTLLGNVTYEKMNEIMHSFDGEQLEKRRLGFGQH